MKTADISRVLVIGAGTMGEGIAQNFAQAGLTARLVDVDPETLKRCREQIAANLELLREYSLLDEPPPIIMDRISFGPGGDLSDLTAAVAQADFVIEAVSENLDLKKKLFASLDAASTDLILCSNTSSLTISEIAAGLKNPGRVVGLHYFYPAHIIPLVEIHGGKDTHPEAVDAVRDLMLKVGKRPIVVRKELPGLIVNRIQAAYNREIAWLLEQGAATAEELDLAAKASYGFRLSCLGPLEIHDLNGLDIVLAAGSKTRKTLFNGTEPSSALVEKVAAGELGVKTGKGWYDYQGRTREEVLRQSHRKLLQQLVSFKALEKMGS